MHAYVHLAHHWYEAHHKGHATWLHTMPACLAALQPGHYMMV